MPRDRIEHPGDAGGRLGNVSHIRQLFITKGGEHEEHEEQLWSESKSFVSFVASVSS
jgi:hypothetical protein